MWSRVFCGVSAEHIIECFVFYSMLGWAVESLYMSICNRKLTNRGSESVRSVRSMDLAQCLGIFC